MTRRPAPEGDPHFDLQSALESSEEYFERVQALMDSAGTLSGHDLLQAATGMSSGYCSFWERPFPQGLEVGQPLFSAVLERPMRNLLGVLQSLGEAESESYPGKPVFNLDAEEELEYFHAWLEDLPSYQRSGILSSQGAGLGTLATFLLLGWWIGQD